LTALSQGPWPLSTREQYAATAAEPADALAVARVHVRAWQVAYRSLLPDEYLNSLKPEDRAPRYTFGGTDPREPMTTVAVDEHGTIRGFATTCAARDADVPGHGELAAIHVDPDWWGRGVGVALLASARAFLLDSGFRRASVGARRQHSRRAVLCQRWLDAGRHSAHGHGVGLAGQTISVFRRTL
jgi:GNAT superfamily N-acetyltransferase